MTDEAIAYCSVVLVWGDKLTMPRTITLRLKCMKPVTSLDVDLGTVESIVCGQ